VTIDVDNAGAVAITLTAGLRQVNQIASDINAALVAALARSAGDDRREAAVLDSVLTLVVSGGAVLTFLGVLAAPWLADAASNNVREATVWLFGGAMLSALVTIPSQRLLALGQVQQNRVAVENGGLAIAQRGHFGVGVDGQELRRKLFAFACVHGHGFKGEAQLFEHQGDLHGVGGGVEEKFQHGVFLASGVEERKIKQPQVSRSCGHCHVPHQSYGRLCAAGLVVNLARSAPSTAHTQQTSLTGTP
jgi:hypothetical protein